jgi:hypothetical protein
MKESYDEGVANHIGPELCAFTREGRGEAWDETVAAIKSLNLWVPLAGAGVFLT